MHMGNKAKSSQTIPRVDTEASTSQPDRTRLFGCDGSPHSDMAVERLYQNINISGNARVLLGDHSNGDKRTGGSASRAEALLEWLHYPRMTSRKESVKDTHADTFQWILQAQDLDDRPNPGFRAWLERGSGIYWIAGKAGSGKSTLMKLITEHRETQEALSVWAGDTVLVCPSFYFWYGGTQMQRSQLGMLRSLLHELLLTNKSLVPVAFPLWTEKDGVEEPDFPEVAAAFLKTLAADGRKICFFIDGLDEYEGDSIRTAALADYLEELARSSTNVKLVVSSRPLHELQAHIKAWPHLMLQDLTSGDISTFVEDELRRNEQMLRLEREEPTATADLVDELVSRASGVFLWVYVVVQSLLDGLESRDKVVDLIIRVHELPTELNELFSVMLERINPRYRAQGFRLLYITQQLLPHVDYAGLHALILSYAEEYGFTTRTLPVCGEIPSAELEERQQAIEVVVRSRCLGLLEVSALKSHTEPYSNSSAALFKELTTNYRVDYIHKTVAEYLDGINIQARVAETSGPTFDVKVAILNALLITCRHGVYPKFLEIFSHFNRRTEQTTKKAQITAVDELDIYLSDPRTRDKMVMRRQGTSKDALRPEGKHWANRVMEGYNRPCPWHDMTLAFAISCDWELFVMEKLQEHGSGLPTKRGRPLLDYAVRPEPSNSPYVYGMSPKIVKCLLEHGADPNAEFNGYSAWSNALYYVDENSFFTRLRRGDTGAHALQVVEVMKLLLAYGAAKRAFCTSNSGKTSAAEVVCLAASYHLGDESFQEVRDGFRDVLAIIQVSKSSRGRVHPASTITNGGDGGDRITAAMAAPFADSSKSELQNTLPSHKASLWQRIKARLLKRRR
ncbi:hypothetical protein Q7P35_002747 [Cladosporium inversicolor]